GAASFSGTAGSVTFAAGSGTATLRVRPTADATAEPDETVLLTLLDAAGYDLGSGAAASGTVSNDDVPAAVGGLTATAVSSSQVDLTWSAASGATGYKVERSADGGATWAQVGTTTAASYAATGLSAGTAYAFRVRAYNAAGSGAYSAAASATTFPASTTGAKKFDFGTGSSAVESGHTRVSEATKYSSALGYGWLAGTVASRDRSSGTAATRDFNFSTDATFAVDLANGTYNVTVTLGDAGYAHDQMGVYLEGAQVDSVTTAKGQFVTKTFTVTVSDGQLTLRLDDLGGADPSAVINALTVEPVTTSDPPPEPSEKLQFDFGTGSSPLSGGYARVSEATKYSATLGYGWLSGTVASRDRGTADPLTRDLNFSSDATFAVDLADGTYLVTVTLGDAAAAHDQMGVYLEGALADSVTAAKGQFVTRTFTVAVADGQLTLRLDDLGGADPNAVVNALTVEEVAPADAQQFDFGTGSSPLAGGAARVTEATKYSAALGHGWLSGTVASRDRGTADPLTRDLNFAADATFAVDLANGTYLVTVTLGDASAAHDQQGVYLEGALADSVTTAKGQFVSRSYTVTVADGQLTLRLDDLGGSDPNAVVNSLEIEELFLSDPSDWLLTSGSHAA
ncbi:MAG TPA: fibronectin type III domain-containing protein, partial [Planctomycetaceae bacterium]